MLCNLISGHLLNVTLLNHFFINSVTVTLQWPREPGAVYHVNTMPETSHTELATDHHNVVINISYNIQYNVSIVTSLCGITTVITESLKYGRFYDKN